jgi:hypothetical protein
MSNPNIKITHIKYPSSKVNKRRETKGLLNTITMCSVLGVLFFVGMKTEGYSQLAINIATVILILTYGELIIVSLAKSVGRLSKKAIA